MAWWFFRLYQPQSSSKIECFTCDCSATLLPSWRLPGGVEYESNWWFRIVEAILFSTLWSRENRNCARSGQGSYESEGLCSASSQRSNQTTLLVDPSWHVLYVITCSGFGRNDASTPNLDHMVIILWMGSIRDQFSTARVTDHVTFQIRSFHLSEAFFICP